MVGVEEGCEYRFRGDLYSQESTFPPVITVVSATTTCASFSRYLHFTGVLNKVTIAYVIF